MLHVINSEIIKQIVLMTKTRKCFIVITMVKKYDKQNIIWLIFIDGLNKQQTSKQMWKYTHFSLLLKSTENR